MPRLDRHFVRLVLATGLAAVPPTHVPTAAQGTALGTFRWQLQPFCNAITVTVSAQGGTFAIDGFDDQCGAAQRAPLTGQAVPNPDGSIGLGLHLVTSPGGRGLDIAARVSLATLGGSWTDSAGNTGTLAFNAATGGGPRPAPTVPVAMLAPAAVGSAQIDTAQVQTRFTGTCPKGHAMTGVEPGGAVRCTVTSTTPTLGVAGSSGLFTSIVVGTDGLPIIGHWELSGSLRITHCGNPTCTSGIVSVLPDQPGFSVGGRPSMAIGTDGFPVVAHGAEQSQVAAIRVTHCGNLTCTSGNVSTMVGSSGLDFPSLAIGSDGLPIISHYNFLARTLHVAHCTTVTCSASDAAVQLDGTANDVGRYGSIAIGTDGLPIISYRFVTAQALRVAHCGNRTCTAGNVYTTVDAAAGSDGFTSIAIGSDGLPVISYYGVTNQALRVLHCGTVDCSSGNLIATVDDLAGIVGRENMLRIGADGLPVIGHTNYATGQLRLTRCHDVRCAAADSVDVAPTQPSIRPSLALDAAGVPIFAHITTPGTGLVVTRCGAPTCRQ